MDEEELAEVIPLGFNNMDLTFTEHWLYIDIEGAEIRMDRHTAREMAKHILKWPDGDNI